MKSIHEAIALNRYRIWRKRRAERLIRGVLIRWYDYEDAGKTAKAQRVLSRLRKQLV